MWNNLNKKLQKNKASTRSTLETDAAPVMEPDTELSDQSVEDAVGQRCSSLELPSHAYALMSRNNSLPAGELVGNVIQTQNVYKFSHMNGLHIGPVYTLNSQVTSAEPSSSQHLMPAQQSLKTGEIIKKTRTIDSMMRSDEELDTKMLNIVASNLGCDYKSFMRTELGFTDATIEHKIIDNQVYGTYEIIYQLLLEWSRNNEGSLGLISNYLWKSGYRHIVKKLKDHWKTTENGQKLKNNTN